VKNKYLCGDKVIMTEKEINKIIQYWHDSSQHDYDTMLGLFRIKRYSDSLFYGHLVLEKILKALVVLQTKEHALPIHNLLLLLQKSGVELLKEEVEFISEANKFNIRAMYPDYKLSFYK
jgi:HEPN domain-containing protein